MAPMHTVSGRMRSVPNLPADDRFAAMRSASVTAFHVMSIATVFAFILILAIWARP
jgi:hypothetical protein